MAPAHMALLLDAHTDAFEARNHGAHPVDLVWTGPENATSYSRDTGVVVRELFESAQRSMLVSTFVIKQGSAGLPACGRKPRDSRHESELLRDLVVNQKGRGAGVGRALLQHGIDWLRRRGVACVMLWMAQQNDGAQRLFDRCVFRPTMIEMTLELGAA